MPFLRPPPHGWSKSNVHHSVLNVTIFSHMVLVFVAAFTSSYRMRVSPSIKEPSMVRNLFVPTQSAGQEASSFAIAHTAICR
jgi:hypothetical protein